VIDDPSSCFWAVPVHCPCPRGRAKFEAKDVPGIIYLLKIGDPYPRWCLGDSGMVKLRTVQHQGRLTCLSEQHVSQCAKTHTHKAVGEGTWARGPPWPRSKVMPFCCWGNIIVHTTVSPAKERGMNRKMQAGYLSDTGLLLIRGMVGVVFVFHGAQKLFGWFDGSGIQGFAGYLTSLGVPFPTLNACLAGSAEFFGGLALLTGIAVRFAAVPLVITMLVASFVVHGEAFSSGKKGMEYPLTLAFVVAGLAFTGPGKVTLPWIVRLAWRRVVKSSPRARRAPSET
jgi:putative oxidoreductase